jgi:hypothetical protein
MLQAVRTRRGRGNEKANGCIALSEGPRDLAVVDGASTKSALSLRTMRASLVRPRSKSSVGAQTMEEDSGKVTESEERNAEFMLRERDLEV